MYCPSCGKEVNPELSFCNYCGVRLSAAGSDVSVLGESTLTTMTGAAAAIPVLGLGIIIGLMAVMKKGLGFGDDMIFVVVFLTFLLLFLAEAGIIWMMISRTKKPKANAAGNMATLPQRRTNELADVVIKGLNATSFSDVSSVTDHTTRTLDPALRKQNGE